MLFFSCKKENAFDCFTSNGGQITEVRNTGSFQFIDVYDNMEVIIHKGADYSVEVSAGKNIIEKITSKVVDGTLKLENLNTCNFVRGYKKKIKINITVPSIRKITNNGVGPIVFDADFSQDALNVRAENSGDIIINGTFNEVRSSSHGNGDIYFNGSAKTLLVYSNGTNFTHAENFKVSDKIYISTYSVCHAYFNFDGLTKFEYYIWSDGNIYYTGNPTVIENLGNEDAKGKLIQQD
jgi:hypothetical protein